MICSRAETAERFWSKTRRDKNGCLLWTGYIKANGYGSFKLHGKMQQAHRVAYALAHGEVPDGFDVDHLCRIRCCVDPDHLEATTHRENVRRGNGWAGRHARKTACVNGHPFNRKNTRIDQRGWRVCRECERERRQTRSLTG